MIILKLREAELLTSQGTSQELAAKKIGVSVQTLIRWRTEYGGLKMDEANRLKQLEKENSKLRKPIASRDAMGDGSAVLSTVLSTLPTAPSDR